MISSPGLKTARASSSRTSTDWLLKYFPNILSIVISLRLYVSSTCMAFTRLNLKKKDTPLHTMHSRKIKCKQFDYFQVKAPRYKETQLWCRFLAGEWNQYDGAFEEKSRGVVLEVTKRDKKQAWRSAEFRVSFSGSEQVNPDAEQELCE